MIETLKKYLKSFYIFCKLTQAGFFYSSNTHKNKYDENYWGFYRFNYEKNGRIEYSIYDIDFEENIFYSMTGGRDGKNYNLFRVDLGKHKEIE